jgi:hypothetical protein
VLLAHSGATTVIGVNAISFKSLVVTHLEDQFIGEIKQRDNSSPVVDAIAEKFFGDITECFVRTMNRYLINHARIAEKLNVSSRIQQSQAEEEEET